MTRERADVKKASVLTMVSLGLIAGMLLAGTPAAAAGPHGSPAPAGDPIPGPVPPSPRAPQRTIQDTIVPHGFFTLPPGHDHFGPRRPHAHRSVAPGVIVPSVIIAGPPVARYGPEEDSGAVGFWSLPDDSSAVYTPSLSYPQPVVSAIPPPPPAPPTPNVVQYETGRFELRGDGIMTPYTWVWIPNPPPPPPSGPPTPASLPRLSDDRPAVRQEHLYRWTDEQGILHLTDSLDSVPRPYRTPVGQTPPS